MCIVDELVSNRCIDYICWDCCILKLLSDRDNGYPFVVLCLSGISDLPLAKERFDPRSIGGPFD